MTNSSSALQLIKIHNTCNLMEEAILYTLQVNEGNRIIDKTKVSDDNVVVLADHGSTWRDMSPCCIVIEKIRYPVKLPRAATTKCHNYTCIPCMCS